MISGPCLLVLVQTLATGGGSIAGTLRDATTNEPLGGGVVAVIDLNRSAVTDSAGQYRLDGIPMGPHRLLVRRIGYTPRTLAVLVPSGGTFEISIALRAEPVVLSAVDGAELTPVLSAMPDRQVDMATVHNHPLLAEADAFQALSAGGGIIAVQPEAPAGMHVRGGASDQVTYLLDGFPIFSPYHSGESFSAWNPDALADAELHAASGTWDGLSGVVTGTSRVPGRQHHGTTGLSTTHMRLTLDGPLGSRAGYLWSERSGFPGFPMPQRDPTYLRAETGDRLVKVEAPVAGGWGRLLGYANENELDTDGLVAGAAANRNAFNWQSSTFGAEWNRSGSAGALRARLWSARADASSTWHPDSSVEHVATRRRDAGLSVTFEREAAGGRTAIGVRMQTSTTAYQMAVDSGMALRYASRTPLAALFVERAQPLSTRLGVVAAIGTTAAAGAGRLSPRATLYWSPAAGLVLSGGYLRLYQFAQSLRNPESVAGTVFPADLMVGASHSGVPIARSDQGIVAADYQPAPRSRLTMQAYVRAFHDIVLVAPTTRDPFATAPFVVGNGTARGISVDWSRTSSRATLFGSYGLQYVQFSAGAMRYTPDYEPRHAVDAGVMLDASRHLSLRLGASGRFARRATALSTPFEWESCNVTDRGCEFAGSPRTNPDSLGASQLPGYVRVDFGLRSRWNIRVAGRQSELALFGTITNVFARTNTLTMAPDPDSRIQTPVTLRPRVPLVFGIDWTF